MAKNNPFWKAESKILLNIFDIKLNLQQENKISKSIFSTANFINVVRSCSSLAFMVYNHERDSDKQKKQTFPASSTAGSGQSTCCSDSLQTELHSGTRGRLWSNRKEKHRWLSQITLKDKTPAKKKRVMWLKKYGSKKKQVTGESEGTATHLRQSLKISLQGLSSRFSLHRSAKTSSMSTRCGDCINTCKQTHTRTHTPSRARTHQKSPTFPIYWGSPKRNTQTQLV